MTGSVSLQYEEVLPSVDNQQDAPPTWDERLPPREDFSGCTRFPSLKFVTAFGPNSSIAARSYAFAASSSVA